MRMLVSGATGFVGQHLTKALVESNEVYALVRGKSHTSVLDDKIHLIRIVDDIAVMIKKIKEEKIEGIIHLASLFLKEHNSTNIDNLIQSNILLGTQLLEIAANSNVKWFINTGTFWQHYHNEMYNPINLYAATKQAFEDIAKYYTETSELTFVTLKLNDTFGPKDTRPKIFNLWEKISKTRETLKMSPGDQLIDISFIDDVVDAYLFLVDSIRNNQIDVNGKVYALKARKRVTLKELAGLYEKVTGKKLDIDWGGLPYRKREVMAPWNNGEEIPGFKPKISLEEGIRRYLNEQQED